MSGSIHRAGVAIASVAVLATVGGAFVLDGYRSAQHAADAATVAATADPTAQGPEVIYVRPAPSPQVVHVTQTATPAPQQILHVVVPSTGDDGPGDD